MTGGIIIFVLVILGLRFAVFTGRWKAVLQVAIVVVGIAAVLALIT